MLPLFRRAATALSLLLAPAAAHAQSSAPVTQDADPALWVVKDRDTTIYLFGTIHVLKPGLGWFDERVKQAFDSSDQVVLEMVTPEPVEMQAIVFKFAMNTTGKTLTERLPEGERAAYAKAMTDIGLPAAAFDQFDPWVAAINLTLIPLMKLGYDPESGAEKALTAAAKAVGKPVIGLETAEQQIGFLDGLSEPAQVAFLTETVKEAGKLPQTIGSMIDEWSKGDAEGLAQLMNDDMGSSPEVMKTLLTDRNVRWADWIAERMKQPGTVFLAVGAGHLAGPDSVQAQLAKHRLKAKRLAY